MVSYSNIFGSFALQDVYLHTNCLATLANMAPHVHRLDAYASQRLISLFHMLSRKYMILLLPSLAMIVSKLATVIKCVSLLT